MNKLMADLGFLFLGLPFPLRFAGGIYHTGLTLSKKNLLSHLYWGTQWTMEIQGVPRQTVILHFALAGRNMQASLGLKVIWEF